jgi:hypothetical protein
MLTKKYPYQTLVKKTTLIILGKLFLTWLIWLVVFFTSQVVDYLSNQISQQKFWATSFLGQFLNF